MSQEKARIQLVEALRDGRIERREFLRGALGLGMSVGTIGLVLQACGSEEKPADAPPPAGHEGTGPGPAPAPEPELGPIEADLHIYMWSDYIAEDTIPNFEKEFNVKVTLDTYESNEEMIAKVQTGAAGYDLVCPSGYAVSVLRHLHLVEQLVKKHIPNYANLAPLFLGSVFDPKNEVTVPWQWGVTGVAYRKDLLGKVPDSWALFQDAALKGKLTMMDDMRDNIGAWLRFLGKSVNSVDAADLAAAKAEALKAKPILASYVSAPVKAQLIAGDVFAAQLWNGDTMQAKVEKAEIEFALPKEGSSIWCDSMCIPKGAKNLRAAHEFLNYILRPEVGAKISDFTGYGSPNLPASEKMVNKVAYPTEADMKNLEYNEDLGAGTAAWDQIWTEIKSG